MRNSGYVMTGGASRATGDDTGDVVDGTKVGRCCFSDDGCVVYVWHSQNDTTKRGESLDRKSYLAVVEG